MRRVGGKTLDDGEMTAYYSSLSKRYGSLRARYRNAINPITPEPHCESKEGFPLDRISVKADSSKNKGMHGFADFFARIIAYIG